MTSSPPPAQVLIVDDEPSIRCLLRDMLEDEACRVATADHGAAALAYLHQTPTLPKVILLDLHMPIMDGLTFLEQKQAEPRLKGIPVILLSARLRHQPDVLPSAVDAFLPKPFDYDLLVALAHRYCHPKH